MVSQPFEYNFIYSKYVDRISTAGFRIFCYEPFTFESSVSNSGNQPICLNDPFHHLEYSFWKKNFVTSKVTSGPWLSSKLLIIIHWQNCLLEYRSCIYAPGCPLNVTQACGKTFSLQKTTQILNNLPQNIDEILVLPSKVPVSFTRLKLPGTSQRLCVCLVCKKNFLITMVQIVKDPFMEIRENI